MTGPKWFESKHKGSQWLQLIIVLPIVLQLLTLMWRINCLRTTMAEIEADANQVVKAIATDLDQSSNIEVLLYAFQLKKIDPELEAFKERWQKQGIAFERLTMTCNYWLGRRVTLEAHYSLKYQSTLIEVLTGDALMHGSLYCSAMVTNTFAQTDEALVVAQILNRKEFIVDADAIISKIVGVISTWYTRWVGG